MGFASIISWFHDGGFVFYDGMFWWLWWVLFKAKFWEVEATWKGGLFGEQLKLNKFRVWRKTEKVPRSFPSLLQQLCILKAQPRKKLAHDIRAYVRKIETAFEDEVAQVGSLGMRYYDMMSLLCCYCSSPCSTLVFPTLNIATIHHPSCSRQHF